MSSVSVLRPAGGPVDPKDQPGADDVVWRQPHTPATTRDDPEGQEAMKVIGESNRMTLKFRKSK